MSDATKSRTVYFIMCDTARGLKRIGSTYNDKATAKSWLKFAVSAWYAKRGWVEEAKIVLDADGNPTAETVELFDKRYNVSLHRTKKPAACPTNSTCGSTSTLAAEHAGSSGPVSSAAPAQQTKPGTT